MDGKFTEVATMHGYSLQTWWGVGHYISIPYQARYINAMYVIVKPHCNVYNNTGKPVFSVVIDTYSSSLSAGEMDNFIEEMETAQQVALYFESILDKG